MLDDDDGLMSVGKRGKRTWCYRLILQIQQQYQPSCMLTSHKMFIFWQLLLQIWLTFNDFVNNGDLPRRSGLPTLNRLAYQDKSYLDSLCKCHHHVTSPMTQPSCAVLCCLCVQLVCPVTWSSEDIVRVIGAWHSMTHNLGMSISTQGVVIAEPTSLHWSGKRK